MSVIEYGDGKMGLLVGQNDQGDPLIAPLAVEIHDPSVVSGGFGAQTVRNVPDAVDKRASDPGYVTEPVYGATGTGTANTAAETTSSEGDQPTS